MNLIPFIALWCLLAVVVLALALYRKVITFHGDDEFIHLGAGEEKLIPHQVALGRRLEFIDRWGQMLTICTAAFGLLLAGVFLYQAWQASLLIK